ncbi:ribonuclease D [Romeria aff. gracilis LEGE 07310]|uniref:Ribonuclease D n=1 Tax=Vasconcelosia minhoensis LEGE 07310 TaxID=915328 RepID=A0A8J7AW05_9CYAN|nr:ribonuclease D [Romeria gracilis]MBE9078093.1 ribonuclease D [Romeria aff. gracilis LEGE 07310]
MDNFQVCDRDLPPDLLERYLAAEAIAADTETMGLNPHRDRLCLVQLSDPEGYVSVLRIARGQTEAPRLKQLLEAPRITKIFHFARFDLAMLQHHLGIVVAPVFCTKIASKLARTYSPRHGLKELVKEIADVELDKSAQSSDWGNATQLSEEQLSYAANDVRYLHKLRQQLITMLKREDRWALAQQCLQCLPTLVELDLMQYDNIFEH